MTQAPPVSNDTGNLRQQKAGRIESPCCQQQLQTISLFSKQASKQAVKYAGTKMNLGPEEQYANYYALLPSSDDLLVASRLLSTGHVTGPGGIGQPL